MGLKIREKNSREKAEKMNEQMKKKKRKNNIAVKGKKKWIDSNLMAQTQQCIVKAEQI